MTPLEKRAWNHFAMIRFQSLLFQQIQKANSKEWIYSRQFSQFNRDLSESVFFSPLQSISFKRVEARRTKMSRRKIAMLHIGIDPIYVFLSNKSSWHFLFDLCINPLFRESECERASAAAWIGNIWLPKAVIWIFRASQFRCLLTLNLAAILCFVQLNIGPKSSIPAKSAGFIDKHIEYFLLENTATHTNTLLVCYFE